MLSNNEIEKKTIKFKSFPKAFYCNNYAVDSWIMILVYVYANNKFYFEYVSLMSCDYDWVTNHLIM